MTKIFTLKEIARDLAAGLDAVAITARDKVLAAGGTQGDAIAAYNAVWGYGLETLAPADAPMVM